MPNWWAEHQTADDLHRSELERLMKAGDALLYALIAQDGCCSVDLSEEWIQAKRALLNDAENNRLLTQVRRVDQKYGPFDEFRYWREAAQDDGTDDA